MLKVTTIIAMLLVPTIAHAADCVDEKVTYVPEVYMRTKPSLYASPLWRMASGVTVQWCGHTATDNRGIIWHWVSFGFREQPWAHNGWVSSRALTADVPLIQPSHEDEQRPNAASTY